MRDSDSGVESRLGQSVLEFFVLLHDGNVSWFQDFVSFTFPLSKVDFLISCVLPWFDLS